MVTTKENTKILPIGDNIAASKSDILVDFVAIMVHDLQGPLVSMKTLLKLLKNGRYNNQNKAHLDLLSSSHNALERAESIIYDLIDIAKTETIGIPVNLDFLDLRELIENSVSVMQGSALEYGVNLQNRVRNSIKVQIDKALFLRVIDNLIFNALKHSKNGGNIYIETQLAEDKIIVVVSDEGVGLGDFDPRELFDKYKQMNLRKEGKYKGVGLGLYFCRLAVEAMGGQIWAEKNPNGGASFKFSLIKDRRKG